MNSYGYNMKLNRILMIGRSIISVMSVGQGRCPDCLDICHDLSGGLVSLVFVMVELYILSNYFAKKDGRGHPSTAAAASQAAEPAVAIFVELPARFLGVVIRET